jgi:AcrR family transcriptional regulator
MSISNAQPRVANKRPYKMARRADKREETRRRIVEAAVELHSTLGPARTSVAQIAERAGVQRHTYYAHFPEERELFLACSGHALARDPLPDVAAWRARPPGWERIRHGLEELYRWYERNAEMAACVIRDAEHHALTCEMTELRMLPTFAAAYEALGEGMSPRAQALLGVSLDFACWRSLRATQDAANAALLMSDAVCALK